MPRGKQLGVASAVACAGLVELGSAVPAKVLSGADISVEVGEHIKKDDPITTNPNVGGFGQAEKGKNMDNVGRSLEQQMMAVDAKGEIEAMRSNGDRAKQAEDGVDGDGAEEAEALKALEVDIEKKLGFSATAARPQGN